MVFKAMDKILRGECGQGKEAEALTLEGFEMGRGREGPAAFAILLMHRRRNARYRNNRKRERKGDILRQSVALQR